MSTLSAVGGRGGGWGTSLGGWGGSGGWSDPRSLPTLSVLGGGGMGGGGGHRFGYHGNRGSVVSLLLPI